jgi:hypothetical protein
MRIPALAAGLVFVSLISAAHAAAPASQPANAPAGRTDHDLHREIAEFDRKYVVEAYEKVGHRDPKWDAVALKLIRAQYEASIRNTYLGGYYTPWDTPEAMDVEARADLANQLLDLGCDDSMALFMAAYALQESAKPQMGCALAFQLADKYAGESKYVPVYKVMMSNEALQHSDRISEGEPELARMREVFRALVRQALSDKETLPKYRAVIWAKLAWMFEDRDQVRCDRIATAVSNVQNPDPWLFETYMGAVEIQRAWMARGGGLANTVTDDGWVGFAKHLTLARTHLERAATLDPTLPHAPALLVTVAMGQSAEDSHKWFREATRRQIDYPPAYYAYRSVVAPKWGGSFAQQMQLAKSVVQSGRFDTRVPAMVMDILDDIEGDARGSSVTEEMMELAPLVDQAMAGYVANGPKGIRTWAISTRIVWAVLAEHWTEARAMLETMPALEDNPASYRDIEPWDLIERVMAMTHPQADAIAQAMSLDDASSRATALEKLIETLKPDDSAAHLANPNWAGAAKLWLQRRHFEAEFEATLASGEWTPLPIGEDLAGWYMQRGQWKADGDNALIGVCTAGLNIISPYELPDRFELRCTVEPVGDVNPRDKSVGVIPAWSPARRAGAMLLADGGGYLTNGRYNYGKFAVEHQGDATTLRFRYNRGRLSVLDEAGNVVITGTLPAGNHRRPAFGGIDLGAGVTWRFSDIAVRVPK